MELTANEAWSRILDSAKAKLPEHGFRAWLAATSAVALSTNHLVVGVPSQFASDWIKHRYARLLEAEAQQLFGHDFRISFEVRSSGGVSPPEIPTMPVVGFEELDQDGEPSGSAETAPPKPVVGTLNPRYTLENCVVGSHNELAAAACQAVAEAPGRAYNPLFIFGGVGLGKTHLMQAIGNAVLKRFPGIRVAYVPTEQFTNELIAAIQARQTSQFHTRYRRIDVLLVDDVHFLAGKEGTQEEFFHTFNALHDAQKQIVLTSDRSPSEIPGLQERLMSRFQWGLVTDIKPPDFETRVAILKLKAAQDGLSMEHEVLTFIAKQFRSSVRELEGAIIKLLAYSSVTRREISPELAAEVLGGAMGPPRDLSPQTIEEAVAEAWDVSVAELYSKKRQRRVTDPRQVAMYLEKVMLDLPYTRIGARFGGRDHSTVIHSIQKVEAQLDKDSSFRDRVNTIRGNLT
ncbi:MAG: chromosomal replication initiator protein DnaA [Gemmatimonadetes bacterium]|uniref:Chromosomal replication initiator protein DnaA n=1 Tax=Candidatus Kutchimonas denitrificans TaxID=3056748 RepID=A0AAE5CA37_9BACT|nr:chromosomal replication initiator protein DnaA [Gemmatimonadota bacterium]NIR74132.1 chromosomal replication initiator protein DnaA [Candidatus Kutchimonas denitrificans]NIS01314.1 chromosomal replication initiator protein DnaA [Gemmatimonadota bacterium]NIT67045.1 chromosomal replication initiator protein DnaA [Gemmatimonadota bacterium]NIU51705.1 chromosomal replication initiator protein DnaA [Gemmatimonadota bacterium]